MKNKLRKALLKKEITLGAWMQIGHPACAEIFARAGFDWICVDLEHGAIDLETMTNIFRTIDAFDCVPVARLPLNDPVWIHRSLDSGSEDRVDEAEKIRVEGREDERALPQPVAARNRDRPFVVEARVGRGKLEEGIVETDLSQMHEAQCECDRKDQPRDNLLSARPG